MVAQKEIRVPALVKDSGLIIPEFVLGSIKNYEIQPMDPRVYKEAPTLAELMHAHFGKNPDGPMGSSEYREDFRGTNSTAMFWNLFKNPRKSEWTSTFLIGEKLIERPENISYRNGVWIAEGGKATQIELMPEGWVTEFDEPTGFPSATSLDIRDARREFGDDIVCLYHNAGSLRAVFHDYTRKGVFQINALQQPDYKNFNIGVRRISY
jgi:hypothetical protein